MRNFVLPMSKIRLALFPFSIIYDAITRIKNFLYSSHLVFSKKFNVPVIVIGNLSTGGTGKTPHTEFVANLIKPIKKTAVLSRGYGRKTTGYILANKASKPEQIGDEPLQIKYNIPDIDVAVCEDRVTGVIRLIENQSSEAIILDDAFQHRKVTGSMYILLTTYNQPFYDDYLLPAGNLRESASNKNRADIIIITKCPSSMMQDKRTEITKKIKPTSKQQLFFTQISYQAAIPFFKGVNFDTIKNVLLVTGIVQPKPLASHLTSMGKTVKRLPFKDHHDYSKMDIQQMVAALNYFEDDFAIVTTSKDAVKLKSLFRDFYPQIPVFEIPITISVLFNQESELKKILTNHVTGN